MSMPFIIYHDESIYQLEEKEMAKVKKLPRHHSKFEKQVREEVKSVKDHHRTMGYAEVPLKPPNNFLNVGGGVRPRPKTTDHTCFRRNLPPIPRRQQSGKVQKTSEANEINQCQGELEKNEKGVKNGKDFKKENVLTAIKMKPKIPIPRYVDSINGDFHDLRLSGLQPAYIHRPKFGKLPKYLIKRIREQAELEERFRDAEVRKQPLCRYVTQEERTELIEGLKHNWEELQKIYQGLPVLTDTIPKSIRKTNLENQLKQLERDINLVERHPYIYVYDESKE